jgi:MFS family permease
VPEVFLVLWKNTTFRHLLIAWSIVALFGSGIGKWQPTFFIRSHGLQTGELGTWLAATAGGGGLLGTYLGGVLAFRYAAQNEGLQLRIMAAAYCGFGALMAAVYLSPDPYLAFVLMGLAFVGGSTVNGPLFATIQTLVPERMRAMSIAVIFLFSNLIGMGLGPLATGMVSDALRPVLGEESLRYALIALCPGYVWCAWHFWSASKTVSRDLEAAQRSDQRSSGATKDSKASASEAQQVGIQSNDADRYAGDLSLPRSGKALPDISSARYEPD